MRAAVIGTNRQQAFRLDPVRSTESLRFGNYGNSMHPCTKALSEQIIPERTDLAA